MWLQQREGGRRKVLEKNEAGEREGISVCVVGDTG